MLCYRSITARVIIFLQCCRRCSCGSIFPPKTAPGFVPTNHVRHSIGAKRSQTRFFASSRTVDVDPRPVSRVAIIGGGLAGLSAAYHMLDAAAGGLQITIFDPAGPGKGGASSVAGGLIHPFSPRGKLIHLGLPALDRSNHLIETAARHRPECIVRDRLYRVALSDNNVVQLQHAAETYPDLATWLSDLEMRTKFGIDSQGGLELGKGCKVIHVPSYLEGLWEECKVKATDINGSIDWELMPDTHQHTLDVMNEQLALYDAVVLSAGAGIIQDQLMSRDEVLPAQLVRGQSIEMDFPDTEDFSNEAFLCGKYVAPFPMDENRSSRRFVIGATHEFKEEPLSPEEVADELKSRSYQMAKRMWDYGEIHRVTSGFRMQSHRGAFGRMPMIGRSKASNGSITHRNTWVFAGLSSRGLIYHGIFGKWLANGVLHDNEELLRVGFADFDWWQKRLKE